MHAMRGLTLICERRRRALALSQEAGDTAGTARGMFGVGLVLQVLRRDWDAAMRYFWQAFGLAEALEESGDLYGRSEIHRHIGFYYLVEDVRPREAVRQLGHSLALRERLGDPRRIPALSSRWARPNWPRGTSRAPSHCCAARCPSRTRPPCCPGASRTPSGISGRPRRPPPMAASAELP